jgi:hypothetical protein
MLKGLSIIFAAATGVCACGGLASALPEDTVPTYAFKASFEVATAMPEPGRRVDYVVNVTSMSSEDVLCDVILHVGNGSDEIHTQRWDSVHFVPDNPWDLQSSFVAATDVKKSYDVSVEVRSHDTGTLLYENAKTSELVFPIN